MATQTFQITTSNVDLTIDSVTVNDYLGICTIKFSALDLRIQNCQLILAQYDIGIGEVIQDLDVKPEDMKEPEYYRDTFTSMTLTFDSVQKNVNIAANGKGYQHTLIWDMKEDIDLAVHTGVKIKLQLKDVDGINDTVVKTSEIDINMAIIIEKYTTPLALLKDTTPEFSFEVPYSCRACNMHFVLVISENADLSNPVKIINSLVSSTGWQFQIADNYMDILSIGVPDISALLPYKARVRHILQAGLDSGKTYYWAVTASHILKKIPMSEMDAIPSDYPYYSVNLGFDVEHYGLTIDKLDVNPEDLFNPEDY